MQKFDVEIEVLTSKLSQKKADVEYLQIQLEGAKLKKVFTQIEEVIDNTKLSLLTVKEFKIYVGEILQTI